MESDRSGNTLSDDARDGLQRAQPLHGRTSGPTRRSTKGQWTEEEDEILRMAVQRFEGKNWKKIAECFKDRTDVQCLHRWQKVLNPNLIKGPWSKEEDEIIIELVNKYGPKKWSTIAQHLPGRIGKQCRERWHNHLNPGINKEAWTQDEELTLIRAHQIYGNKWAELTKFLPGRTDNAIKNHWHSSVKKKMDMYLASGLLSQFQGAPVVSHPNHSETSSSPMIQPDEDDRAEAVESFDCSTSQSTNNSINKTEHPRGNFRVMEESSPIPRSEGYCPAFQEDTCSVPEKPTELGDKSLEHDLSLNWATFAGKDQLNANELPDMSLLDLGKEPSLPGMDNHEKTTFPTGTCAEGASVSMINMVVDSDTPNPIADSDCQRVCSEDGLDGCSFGNVIRDIDGHADSLLYDCSNSQMPHVPSDVMATPFTRSLSTPTVPVPDYDPLMFGTNPDQYSHSPYVDAEQEPISPCPHDGFMYAKVSDCFPCGYNSNEANIQPKLAPAKDFVLEPMNDSQCCSSKEKDQSESEEKKDLGALFYEPPRFPSLEIPFFSCDLVQSGSDMHQEFSPLGIRQLMISSVTPFKLWDSPSRDDSPVAVLKSAAKSFTGTPSILKKRHHDLVSPLSEKRGTKKLDSISKPESFSNPTDDFSGLDIMFNECIDQKGAMLLSSPKGNERFEAPFFEKENMAPACKQSKKVGYESILISESRISQEELYLSECSDKINEQTAMAEVKPKAAGKDALGMDKECSGILVEQDMNNMLFFSPDPFGIKGDRSTGPSARNRLSAQKDGTNVVITTSMQSLSPSEKKVESTGKGLTFENNSIFVETPFRKSIESPSALKSPWPFNTFVPGPRVDTDITIEDFGYFLSPGDRSYDAIGLMKQLGEQTASAFSDAQEVLGDETPESLLKGKYTTCQEAEKGNHYSPKSQAEHHVFKASNLMIERRTLDFSECGTPPAKENSRALVSHG